MRIRQQSARTRPSYRSSMPTARLAVETLESRLVPYAISSNAWPSPQLITISFEPDGTNLGGVSSNLFATFNAKWPTATWQNQIVRAAQVWAQQANLNFTVVSDSGAPTGSGSYVQGDPTMGDIRIGGYNFGSNALASAYQPPPVNNYSVAGDMEFNTGQVFNIGNTYDLFTVAAHEFGHALGLYHSTISSAVMYAAYNTRKSALTSDDIAGVQAIYGARKPDAYDAAGGDDSFQTAANISSQISATTLTAELNQLDITTTADQDYYKVTAPSGTVGNLTVRVQSKGLSLLAPTLTVYAADQSQKAFVSGAGQYGTTLTATVAGVSAGQIFYIEVAGADTSPFGTGAYALSLNFGSGPTPTATPPATAKMTNGALTAGGGLANKVGEFRVNTTIAHEQQNPVTTMAPDGRSVVVWQSNQQDGSGWGIYAQRYSATGIPVGGEFRVNTTTQDDQTSPSVAMASDGSFVIAWQSHNQDGSGWGIYAQRYDANGVAQGSEFRVNTTTQDDQTSPSVAIAADGSFVIAWQSHNQDGSGWGIYAQRYNASGTVQGGEFLVNTTSNDDQTSPSVAIAANDSFVITWQSHNQDGSGWGVYAQRYSATGVALGGEFRVNTTTQDDQLSPKVAMAGDGSFVVTWASQSEDGSGWGIYAQRYDPNGLALGGEFRVNTTTQDDQMAPSIGMAADGTFAIAWESHNQDGSGWGIYAQRYSNSGVAQGGEFQVNSTTANDQTAPTVGMAADGSFMINWQSNNQDGDSWGVYGQRYGANGDLNLSASDSTGPSWVRNRLHPPGCCCPFCKGGYVPLVNVSVSSNDTPASSGQRTEQSASAVRPMAEGLWTTASLMTPEQGSAGAECHSPNPSPDQLELPSRATSTPALSSQAQSHPATDQLLAWSADQTDKTLIAEDALLELESFSYRRTLPFAVPPDQEVTFGSAAETISLGAALVATTPASRAQEMAWDQACHAYFKDQPVAAGNDELRETEPVVSDGSISAVAAGLAAALFAGFGPTWDWPVGRERRWAESPVGERRRALRFPCHLGVSCRQVGADRRDRRSAVAWNLSARGVHLVLSRPFLPGSLLALELEGAGQGPTHWLLTRVVRVSERMPGRWVLGCAFEQPLAEPEVQSLLLGPAAHLTPK
jgi:hypothetical protein